MKKHWIRLAAAGLLALLLTGCGGTAQAQHYDMTAKQFAYTPSELTVKKGQPVEIQVRSLDVTHGFAIEELGVHQEIPAGQTVTIRFTPQRTGDFAIFCTVFCGTGHAAHRGVIHVVP